MSNTNDELKERIEIKLLWLSHALTSNEKEALENCVLELVEANSYSDGERERIAFNKGIIWATEYLTDLRLKKENR